MLSYVVIIRMGTMDIIGILAGESDTVVKIEHPFIVQYGSASGPLTLAPYCALTDESFFEFKRTSIDFLVTANPIIAERFVNMIDALEQSQTESLLDYMSGDTEVDELESSIGHKTYIEGNDTVH